MTSLARFTFRGAINFYPAGGQIPGLLSVSPLIIPANPVDCTLINTSRSRFNPHKVTHVCPLNGRALLVARRSIAVCGDRRPRLNIGAAGLNGRLVVKASMRGLVRVVLFFSSRPACHPLCLFQQSSALSRRIQFPQEPTRSQPPHNGTRHIHFATATRANITIL
jgi:hypothetical protein